MDAVAVDGRNQLASARLDAGTCDGFAFTYWRSRARGGFAAEFWSASAW